MIVVDKQMVINIEEALSDADYACYKGCDTYGAYDALKECLIKITEEYYEGELKKMNKCCYDKDKECKDSLDCEISCFKEELVIELMEKHKDIIKLGGDN